MVERVVAQFQKELILSASNFQFQIKAYLSFLGAKVFWQV